MRKTTIILFLSIFASSFGICQKQMTEVIICSTIHGAHRINPNYSYDTLFAFIEKYNPDIIGVEIRKEDIDSSSTYLKNNYPFEMYECIKKYPNKEVLGFDWLGSDIEGKAIPENYWREISTIKKTERKLNQDSTMLKKLSILEIIVEEKNKLGQNASLSEMSDGRYDIINSIYYKQLAELLQNTEYEILSDFYQKRDEQIALNIIEIIKSNIGEKMIFLIGADHRDYTLKKVQQELGNQILLDSFD